MNHDLVSYYKDRAQEYEKVYLKPERQNDLQKATTILQSLFLQKKVVEIACGTGYWTERIADTATSILATDINKSVIEIAENKHYKNQVTFELSDIYNCSFDKKYDGVFGGFIWSHILLQDLDKFIDNIKDLVISDGTIVFMDNNYVEGSNHTITKTDEHGNTYQTRNLENGTSHLVLKNFPTKEFIFDKLSDIATEINFINLTYYWIVTFKPIENT
ncbi:MAG: class I SAM-dependent methyltransferase [Saprospiraceae bacterium]|nr:class I SAM-dependent methyltransferase [Saprospiraceae bacterium]